MKPSPNRQAVVVGTFVTVAGAILIAGVLTVGDLNGTFTRKISVTAVFDEVSGLKLGANIWFSGLKVGTVKGLRFRDGARVEVELGVEADAATHIPGDALARIGSDGLIGSKIVVLSGGTAEAAPLAGGDELEIGTALSMDDVLAVAQENNQNLLVITKDLKGLTGKISRGEGTVGKLLQDDALYTRLDETIVDLRATALSARGIASDFEGIAHNAARPGSFVHDLSADRTTYASVTASVAGLKQASERTALLVDGVAAKVNDPNTPVGALLGDEAMGKDLHVTLAQLRAGSGLLAEDLEALQHNFLLRPYFRRQARAERRAAGDTAGQK